MIKLIKDFKEFAVKGNMIEIAIGVIIGASFNKVIDALVKQILMPPLALMTNGNNWENKKSILRESVVDANGKTIVDEIAIGYGRLIEVSIDFMIIAFVVFLVIKFMNKLTNSAQDVKNKTVKTPKDIELLHRVTELLEQQNELLLKKK